MPTRLLHAVTTHYFTVDGGPADPVVTGAAAGRTVPVEGLSR